MNIKSLQIAVVPDVSKTARGVVIRGTPRKPPKDPVASENETSPEKEISVGKKTSWSPSAAQANAASSPPKSQDSLYKTKQGEEEAKEKEQ